MRAALDSNRSYAGILRLSLASRALTSHLLVAPRFSVRPYATNHVALLLLLEPNATRRREMARLEACIISGSSHAVDAEGPLRYHA